MKLKLAIVSLALFLCANTVLAAETDWQGLNPNLSPGTLPNGVVVVAPTASVVAGEYHASQSITLSAPGSNSIRYTTDGTVPSCPSTGTLYAGAFAINANATLKAIACYQSDNTISSALSTYAYTFTCTTASVANGTVAAYPSCAISCNVTYTLSGSTCVYSGGGGGGGGGGGPAYSAGPTAPAGGFVLKINNGATSTLSTSVVLTINGGTQATKMAIANGTDFSNSGQESYAISKSWILPSGNGSKTVCAKFYTSGGSPSDNVCASIYLGVSPAGNTGSQSGGESGAGTTTTTNSRLDYLISITSFGQTNAYVREMQQLLKALGHFTYPTITGYYGAATQAAIRAYQNGQTSSGGSSNNGSGNSSGTGSGSSDLTFNFRGTLVPLAKPLAQMNRNDLVAFILQLIAIVQGH